MLISGVCCAVFVVGFFFTEAIISGLQDAPYAKLSGLFYPCFCPWVICFAIKRKRFDNVTEAMLKYSRCPHCGYDLRMLPVDPEDGATVCPECGCAWELPSETR